MKFENSTKSSLLFLKHSKAQLCQTCHCKKKFLFLLKYCLTVLAVYGRLSKDSTSKKIWCLWHKGAENDSDTYSVNYKVKKKHTQKYIG